jgi:phosphodiesterase/alkaline phosphatase D-like protein
VVYWPKESQDRSHATSWQAVDPEADFTRQFQLTHLAAGTRYQLKVEGRPLHATEPTCTLSGGFETAPQAATAARVAFTVVTCQEYCDDPENGHRIYPLM